MSGLDEFRNSITERFFGLSSLTELKEFEANLNQQNPFSAALGFLIQSWITPLQQQGIEVFEPRSYVSEDLSAAVLGTCPVVFMGTNEWATKPYLDQNVHMQRVQIFSNHMKKIRNIFPGKKIVFSLVPEKDYVLDQYFFQTSRFSAIDAAIADLHRACSELGIFFVYNDYLAPLQKYEDIECFKYLDTHLPARHYIQIFAELLGGLGFDWQEIAPNFKFMEKPFYGDLQMKFGSSDSKPMLFKVARAKTEQLKIIAGMQNFSEPLGDTWQVIENDNPMINQKVLVLGDSHSSILANDHLTYLFAVTFKRCEFFWNPLGTRENPKPTDADFVVLEMSQRFLL